MAVLITYGELVFINDDAISLSPWLNAAISSVPLFAIGIVVAIRSTKVRGARERKSTLASANVQEYRVVQKNSCMLESSRSLSAH